MKKLKTWKREAAIIQLVMHWLLVMFICYQAFTTGDAVDSLTDLAVGLAVWVYSFAAAAFGMDSWAKQIKPPAQLPTEGV